MPATKQALETLGGQFRCLSESVSRCGWGHLCSGKLRLIYCGNGYGTTGIGTAVAEIFR
jgi:hypothetical protein